MRMIKLKCQGYCGNFKDKVKIMLKYWSVMSRKSWNIKNKVEMAKIKLKCRGYSQNVEDKVEMSKKKSK